MKLARTVLLVALFAAGEAVAQQPAVGSAASSTNAATAFRYNRSLWSLPAGSQRYDRQDFISKQSSPSSGFLLASSSQRLQAKTPLSLSLGLLESVNPFAPLKQKNEPTRIYHLSTRAWTTTVGWHPGASAFPDAITHEW